MEGAEDDPAKAASDLKARKISSKDFVIGLPRAERPRTQWALSNMQSQNPRELRRSSLFRILPWQGLQTSS
jgi:N-acetylmuramic acid 6-phosphate (MurNAc-6-P) etherase